MIEITTNISINVNAALFRGSNGCLRDDSKWRRLMDITMKTVEEDETRAQRGILVQLHFSHGLARHQRQKGTHARTFTKRAGSSSSQIHRHQNTTPSSAKYSTGSEPQHLVSANTVGPFPPIKL
ncbi:hypothetical protein RB8103 [Rhodopirellula baltica SH 1]|uniref:Uncharacterized protein n=1 Tax=Rhodopirellula baltica (strain DSM 10527 / NCIMB 13988 / SH1) TaxID=243090 RepID=Q7UG57_RHOBA|nr:hypothetical protein RB8103 [Rhodopirellula baltica SH 1]